MDEIENQTKKQKPYKNLKRGNPNWKKGQSANPAGRPPKELSITSVLKEKLWANDGAKIQELADVWLECCIKRKDMAAFRELLDRVEGRVPQKSEVDLNAKIELSEKDRLIISKFKNEIIKTFSNTYGS